MHYLLSLSTWQTFGLVGHWFYSFDKEESILVTHLMVVIGIKTKLYDFMYSKNEPEQSHKNIAQDLSIFIYPYSELYENDS